MIIQPAVPVPRANVLLCTVTASRLDVDAIPSSVPVWIARIPSSKAVLVVLAPKQFVASWLVILVRLPMRAKFATHCSRIFHRVKYFVTAFVLNASSYIVLVSTMVKCANPMYARASVATIQKRTMKAFVSRRCNKHWKNVPMRFKSRLAKSDSDAPARTIVAFENIANAFGQTCNAQTSVLAVTAEIARKIKFL
jgi:hypothetical protein